MTKWKAVLFCPAIAAILATVLVPLRAAESPKVGDKIELSATSQTGVPLHPDPFEPFDQFDRVPDKATATVLEIQQNAHWLKVKIDSPSKNGWITSRYVGQVIPQTTPTPSGPQLAVGNTVRLRATSAQGVPLHPDPNPPFNGFQRVSDGSLAKILEIKPNSVWLKIKVNSGGSEGWIQQKYVLEVVPDTPGPTVDERESEVWASPESCQAVIDSHVRMRKANPNALRVGAWNLRWFPRGCKPGEQCPENRTNVDWLALTIVWMGLDILAMEEVLLATEDKPELDLLVQRLHQLTGGVWITNLQACGPQAAQHVGFLWNADRVTLSNFSDEEQLNAAYDGVHPCAGNLRPGRYARVNSNHPGGVDFHLLVVHLDSGPHNKDYQDRRMAIDALDELEIQGTPLPELGDPGEAGDNDILIVGDWNTMGNEDPPAVSEQAEISLFDQELAPGFVRILPDKPCSEYFEKNGGLLDHAVRSHGMEEAPVAVRVTGYCSVLNCQSFTNNSRPVAYESLSDHCPIVLEIADADKD